MTAPNDSSQSQTPGLWQALWRFRYLALVAAAALLLWNLNYAPVWNPDEGRYISASLEMFAPLDASTPDWVVPHLNSLPRLNKPPLVYWCAATLFKILGPSAASARLVPALAAIGVLLLLWRMGTLLFGEKTGLLAALIWVSSMLPFTLARMLSTDMLLCFAMAMALFGIYKIASPQENRTATWANIAIAGIGLGLALLAKGPVGVALPMAILIAWLIVIQNKKSGLGNARGFTRRALVAVPCALLLAGVLAAPWYLAVSRSHPDFLKNFVLGENIARLTGATAYHDAKPMWFYAPVIIGGFLPWTLFLWPAFQAALAPFFAREGDDLSTPALDSRVGARWFLWLWAAAVITLFSISHTKLVTYILPAFAPLSLLMADAFANRQNEKTLRRAAAATIALLLLLAFVLPILFLMPKLLADKILPRADALPFVALMSAILFMGAFGLRRALRFRENSAFTVRAASTLVATGALLFMALTGFMGRFATYEDISPMLVALRPFLQPGDKIVQFKTFQPSVMFYTRAPSVVIDFLNSSGLEESSVHSSPLFAQNQTALRALFQSPHRVYILVRWRHSYWPDLPPHYVVAANNDYRLLCNRPAPPGFSFNFVTPAKRNRILSPACQAHSAQC